MKMFLGEYQPNITEGSRIALPKKIRDQISGSELILSRGFESCIFAYAKEDWLLESQKQIENHISDLKSRDLRRYMFASATEITLDAQGRFVLPANLKSYANLSKNIILIGAGDHVEIWDKALWDRHLEKISKEFAAE